MKILFVEFAQNFGGARKASLEMAKLLNVKHAVTFADITGKCKPFVKACENSGVSFKILLPQCDSHNIRNARSLRGRIKSILSYPRYLYKLNKAITEIGEDKDYICVSSFRPIQSFIFGKPKAKVVFFAHAWYSADIFPKWQRFLLKNYVDKIACISEATRQAMFNNKINTLENMYVVHNCITESVTKVPPAEIGASKDDFVIMLCGGFTIGKGQHVAVLIAKELKKRGFKFKMILAGITYDSNESMNYYHRVRSMISENNLEKEIEIVLNHHNVYDYMQASDVIIHPSSTEGFPLALMEAQIMGKPIVANAVGGVTDMILDGFTGFLPQYNKVEEYADMIILLHDNKELYNYVAENAYQLAKNCFNPVVQKTELESIFSM